MNNIQLMQLSSGIANLVMGMETDLIINIAKYLASGNLESSTAAWKIKKLGQLGSLTKNNIRTIAEYAAIQPDMQELTMYNAAIQSIKEIEPGLQKLAKKGVIEGTNVPMTESMNNILKSLGKQTKNDLNLINTTMLYKAKATAQKMINTTAELANKQSFLDSLNKAAGKTVTGIESRQAALRQCIGEMSQKGIPAFVDKMGRNWSPEAYTNMCIRTTCQRVANETQFQRCDDYGVSLVEVSSHSGARPLCAKDQGKIFDRNNKSGYVEDLSGKKIKYLPWNSTSYGKPAGLLGINCGHHIYPFIPGLNLQTYFPYNEEENSEQYKKLQGQRQLERKVRASKRECMALKELGDEEVLSSATVKLKKQQSRLKSYCKDNGLPYKPDRVATPGYGRSEVSKVTASYKKAVKLQEAQLKFDDMLDNSVENGIIDLYKGKGIKILSNAEISETVKEKVFKATEKVTSDIKALEKCSESIRFGDVIGGLAENVYYSTTGKNQITLLSSAFSKPDILLKTLETDFAKGISYNTNFIESLVAHEMGHNAHIALALRRSGLDYGKPLSIIQQHLFSNEYEKIKREIYIAAFNNEDYKQIQKMCEKRLGSITKDAPCELIAQSFGNYYYGAEKQSIAKAIVKYFKKGLE